MASSPELDVDVPPEMPALDLSNPNLVLDASDGAAARVSIQEGDEAEPGDADEPLPQLAPLPPAPAASSTGPLDNTTTRTGALVRSTSGTYRVLKRLAAGGMGEVFHARKLGPGDSWTKDVALKRVVPAHRDDPAIHRSLLDEARLAALLTHRNIASVFDFVELEKGGFLLVMEYLPGFTLRALLSMTQEKARRLSESFALYVTAEVAEALAYAHAATHDGRALGIVHRDVSPHNILVTDSGGVKLLDFGVALSRLENRDKTQTGAVKGKASYMSPEQASGAELDGRSDQFALAAVAFELLTGKRLFSGKSEAVTLTQIANATPERISERLRDLPEGIKPLLSRALNPAPAERYPTCLEFAEALRDYLHGLGRYGPIQARVEVEALQAAPDATSPDETRDLRQAGSSAPEASKSPVTVPTPATPLTPPSSDSAVQRQAAALEALYKPAPARPAGALLPAIVFAVVLAAGVSAVAYLTSRAPATTHEETVKTPAQEHAEAEARAKEAQPPPPPRLADAPAPPQATPSPSPSSIHPPALASRPTSHKTAAQPTSVAPPQPTPQSTQAPTAPAPAVVTPQAPPLRSLATRMALGGSATPTEAGTTTAVHIPRGTRLRARLDDVVDPAHPGHVTVTLTEAFQAGGVPDGAKALCLVGAVNADRIAVTCDSLTVGKQAFTFGASLYGADGRPGLPLPHAAPSGVSGAVVSSGERLLNGVRPSGTAGEVLDAARDVAASAARDASVSKSPVSALPQGTAVLLLVTTDLR